MEPASGPASADAPRTLGAPLRVVIVGGGITGLATAYRILKSSKEGASRVGPVAVTLLEGSDRLGGDIKTDRIDGLVIDGGPDAFVAAKPDATALCEELGLGARLIGTIARNRKVYVLFGGRLHALPEGMFLTVPTQLIATARSGLLSWEGKARAALDLVLPPKLDARDESIGSFIRRRLGDEVAQRIADPLLGGIYAGDLETLSVRATFPQLVQLEEQYGSLIRGALELRAAEAKEGGASGAFSRLFSRRSTRAPSAFCSLVSGMGELIDVLAAQIEELGGEIRTRTSALSVVRPSDPTVPDGAARFLVKTRLPSGVSEAIPADAVVIAAPAYRAAEVIRELDPDLAELARDVPYESTATVILAFPRSAIPHALDAVGMIIPKTERRRILALTFITSKWEGRAPPGTAMIRVFIGGHSDPHASAQDDEALIELATSELSSILGVSAAPTLARVYRFPRGSAQLLVGHLERMAKVRARTALHPGLYLAGGAFDGVGIPDCVRQANEIAQKIIR